MAQRLVVEAEIGSAFFLRLLEAQRARSNRDAIAVFQELFELLFAVYKNLVRASFDLTIDDGAINKHEGTIGIRPNMSVVSRCTRIVEHDLIVGCAPNHARGAR